MNTDATPVRVTGLFHCHASPRAGWVTITCQDTSSHPRRKTVSPVLWKQLLPLSDREFDATCVLELGLGSRQHP